MLEIKDLHVKAENKKIIKGVNLSFQKGDVVAIMGPNGNGKSTLLKAIMKHPKYEITKGYITYKGKKISDMQTDEIAKESIFFASQSPQEVSGVLNIDFIRAAMKSQSGKEPDIFSFYKNIKREAEELKLPSDYDKRSVNEGFSGGEKKKSEIVQLIMLDPDVILLDEIDSGLDVDSLNTIANKINQIIENKNKILIMVSHYERLFKLVKPNKAVVIIDGKISASGGYEIIQRIDKDGYD
jgi:Fe-S cluster assembly ATP-binding protein